MDGILEVPAERKLKETFPGTELNATWTALGDDTLTLPIGTLTNSPNESGRYVYIPELIDCIKLMGSSQPARGD